MSLGTIFDSGPHASLINCSHIRRICYAMQSSDPIQPSPSSNPPAFLTTQLDLTPHCPDVPMGLSVPPASNRGFIARPAMTWGCSVPTVISVGCPRACRCVNRPKVA